MKSVSTSRIEIMPPPAQEQVTTTPFHQLVLRTLRPGARVLLCGADPALMAAIEAEGVSATELPLVEVMVGGPQASPASVRRLRDAIGSFGPDTIVFAEAFRPQSAEPGEALRNIAAAAPRAALVLHYFNTISSSALVAAIAGEVTPAGIAKPQLTGWLQLAGLQVTHEEVIASTTQPPLAIDTARSLEALLQQLNPDTQGHHLAVVARPSLTEVLPLAAQHEPELLSVIIRHHSLARLESLDKAVFSLACQAYPNLEIVVSSQCRGGDAVRRLTQVLTRHQPVGKFRFQIVHLPSEADIRAKLINEGVKAAHGQYVAFLDDDDVVYPQHYTKLIAALRAGTGAWAIGRTRRAYFTASADGVLHCSYKDEMPRGKDFDLVRLIRDNYLTCHSYVLDRFRTGRFPIRFEEALSLNEDYVFVLRLCALFRPEFLAEGPSCEYRIRSDGSNSILAGKQSDRDQRRKERRWAMANLIKDNMRENAQLVLSEGDLLEFVDRAMAEQRPAEEAPPSPAPSWAFGRPEQTRDALRHRIVDGANLAVKARLPWAHELAKKALLRLSKHL